ncbi:MAG: hypothetical protein ACXVNM_12150 [Bacteroidia bacterium]
MQIEINKPINKVVELFDNPANMKHVWKAFCVLSLLVGCQDGQRHGQA